MYSKQILVELERSKKGLPVIWEQGGGMSNTGFATVICGPDGSPLKPLFIATRGTLACSKHALFVVKVGCLVVKVERHKKNHETVVYEIKELKEKTALLEPICIYTEKAGWFETERWETKDLQGGPIHDAIREALFKTECYHCREPHYFIPK